MQYLQKWPYNDDKNHMSKLAPHWSGILVVSSIWFSPKETHSRGWSRMFDCVEADLWLSRDHICLLESNQRIKLTMFRIKLNKYKNAINNPTKKQQKI